MGLGSANQYAQTADKIIAPGVPGGGEGDEVRGKSDLPPFWALVESPCKARFRLCNGPGRSDEQPHLLFAPHHGVAATNSFLEGADERLGGDRRDPLKADLSDHKGQRCLWQCDLGDGRPEGGRNHGSHVTSHSPAPAYPP